MASLKEEEMLSLTETALNLALEKGADEAEAFMFQGLTTTVTIERGQITKSSRIIDQGIGIRAAIKKAVGFAYANAVDTREAFERNVLKAVRSAKASKPDDNWQGLPMKKPFTSVNNTFDKTFFMISSDDLVEAASKMLERAEKVDKRVLPIEGGVGASIAYKAVANSNGVLGFDRGTIIECSLATIAREKGEVTPVCFEFEIERNYKIKPEWVGEEAARLAVSALKAQKVENKNMKIVFTHFSLHQLLHYTLLNAFKADYVQRNQSALQGKIGEKIASEKITVYDDGLLDGGLRTWKFDGEGVPQQRTLVIEKGVLRNFIYDNYTARQEGKESTGNAFRAGYLSTPNIEPTNFRFMLGKKSPEELIGEIDEGLLIYSLQGAHSSNPASGEFSVVASPAFKIKDGEIVNAVRNVMVAGNVFQVMENISDLADNGRKIGAIVAPWILVENVKVIGK